MSRLDHASPLRAVREIAADIKLHHSVFAMPFAVLGAFMAADPAGGHAIDWPRFGGILGLIVLAMVFARTVAMLANRLVDREIDARNPRTAGRAIPGGRLSPAAARTALVASAAGFGLVCVSFGLLYGNWWPAWLGAPVLAWLAAYPYLKRFTSLCHLYLGASLAMSPLAAAIAVDPRTLGQPALWLLAVMVMCWVAGFDIIYALQDVTVDRGQGYYSMPARLGQAGALAVSRGLHAVAVACLVTAWLVDERLGALFGAGVAIVAALLVYEQATVARWGTTRMALAFFTVNGIIGCVLGVLGVIDVLA